MCLAAKELGVQVYASQTADESLGPLPFGLDRLSWYTMCAHVYVYYCISWKSFPFATKLHHKLQREAVVEPWSYFKLVVLTKFVFLEIHPNGSKWWVANLGGELLSHHQAQWCCHTPLPWYMYLHFGSCWGIVLGNCVIILWLYRWSFANIK